MRKDMDKQITECYRIGSNQKYRDIRGKVKNEDIDHVPRKQGMRKPHSLYKGWDRKEFGENLNPLYRFLDKQVGRPWDKVYSEMCEHIKQDSATQLHILQHVFSYIELETWMGDDGEVYVTGYNQPVCVSKDKEAYTCYTQLYVHPVTNLVCKTKVKKRKKKKEEVTRHYLKDNTVLEKVDGIWYRYYVKPLPKPRWIRYTTSQLEHKPYWAGKGYWYQPIPSDCIYTDEKQYRYRNAAFDKHGERRWYAYKKNQLNSKQLKKWGLQNDQELG